jgi:uncharacterized membrane protein YeaQ/YmgE (transglycosylase-associated protein family)
MSIIGLVILLLIAAIAGSLGQSLAGYSAGGCLMSIVVGFIGAFLGMWIATTLKLPEPMAVSIDGESFPLLWAVIGSALFCGILSLLSRRRRLI